MGRAVCFGMKFLLCLQAELVLVSKLGLEVQTFDLESYGGAHHQCQLSPI